MARVLFSADEHLNSVAVNDELDRCCGIIGHRRPLGRESHPVLGEGEALSTILRKRAPHQSIGLGPPSLQRAMI